MSTETRGRTIQECRHCGAGAPSDAHFCPQCEKILSLARHGNYFTFFGLPRKLGIDLADLEQRFRLLSRQFHPDYYYNATPAERVASLERSSYLNDAYRTLRQPAARMEYLLQVEGMALERDARPAAVPPELLEEVFELNEQLEQIREAAESGVPAAQLRARLEAARRAIERKRAAHERELEALAAEWDRLVEAGAPAAERRATLEKLRTQLVERNYITNLLATAERAVPQA
jgi:molecular chaperone HscB